MDTILSIYNFEITGRLGNGSSSIVYLAKTPDTKKFVIKVSKNPEWNNSLKREIFVLKYLNKINCPYVPNYHRRFFVKDLRSVVVEYYDGSFTFSEIRHYLFNRPIMFAKTIANLIRAISFLHSHGVYHLDIKPENILYIRDGNRVILIDFNISKINNEKVKHNLDDGLRGTYPYMSPEFYTILYNLDLLSGCDVWALGATIYTMIMEKPFFRLPEGQRLNYGTFTHYYFSPKGEFERTAKHKVKRVLYQNKFVLDVMKRCLVFHPFDRISISNLLNMIPNTY